MMGILTSLNAKKSSFSTIEDPSAKSPEIIANWQVSSSSFNLSEIWRIIFLCLTEPKWTSDKWTILISCFKLSNFKVFSLTTNLWAL